jgi:adenine phosphoribosyltransferase
VDPVLRDRLRAAFRWIPLPPPATHLVSDRSGWWRDPVLVARLGPALAALHPDADPTIVVAPEVTGFVLGPLVAHALGTGFVGAYRADRHRAVAEPTTWGTAVDDHRGEHPRLGVADRHVQRGDRVLVVDDWIATGAQVRAVHAALAARGARPVGVAVIVDECDPRTRADLAVRGLLTGADL